MTSGIYKLTFNDGSFYIGKSDNIERRWKEHFNKFEKGIAAKNLQNSFNMYGYPSREILIYCHKDNIDVLEAAAINLAKDYKGCLNTSIPPDPGFRQYETDIVDLSLREQMDLIIQLRGRVKLLENNIVKIKNGTALNNAEIRIAALKEEIYRLRSRSFLARLFNWE